MTNCIVYLINDDVAKKFEERSVGGKKVQTSSQGTRLKWPHITIHTKRSTDFIDSRRFCGCHRNLYKQRLSYFVHDLNAGRSAGGGGNGGDTRKSCNVRQRRD